MLLWNTLDSGFSLAMVACIFWTSNQVMPPTTKRMTNGWSSGLGFATFMKNLKNKIRTLTMSIMRNS